MRGLTDNQKAAISARRVGLCYFMQLALASQTIRVWNGRSVRYTLGSNWQGVGEFGVIDGVSGDQSLTTQTISLALVGIPTQFIKNGVVESTRSERYQNRPLDVFVGIINPDTNDLIDDAVPLWSGVADVLSFKLGVAFSCALTGQGLESLMRRSNGYNMTTVSHNLRFGLPANADLFFEAQNRLMGVPRPSLSN